MGDAPGARRGNEPPPTDREERASQQNLQYGLASSQHQNYQYQNQYSQLSAPSSRSEPFNLSQLSGALPNYPDFSAQRYPPTSSGPNYPLHNSQLFASSAVTPQGHNIAYANAFSNQYPGQFSTGQGQSIQNAQAGSNPAQMYYNAPGYATNTQQHAQNYYLTQGQYVPQSPVFPILSGGQQYAARGAFPGNAHQHQQRSREQIYGQPGRASSTASSSSSVVRGPPRKPRQSGHAIWIGNLPPQTALMDLVRHVCKESNGLESLFLISKSNCAFANFKDDAACTEAQVKIHDSRFQTVRLVSRLRRPSVSTPMAATVISNEPSASPSSVSLVEDDTASSTPDSEVVESKIPEVDVEPIQDGEKPKERFFIVKSLTVEDLELSVRNGIWATQSHNEEALTRAFEDAENVYLVFSANKSGEYFGYARMSSTINDDPAAAIEFAPKAQPIEDPTGELPKAISTAADDVTPKGRIIDDSARGTIFWEVEKDDSDAEEEESEQGEVPPAKAWGKPFKLEWILTTRLPFYKTRGLRNPWNSNREVKIARDGQELETSVGKRLLGLFHRVPSPIGPITQMPSVQMMSGYAPHLQRF